MTIEEFNQATTRLKIGPGDIVDVYTTLRNYTGTLTIFGTVLIVRDSQLKQFALSLDKIESLSPRSRAAT